jgi:hypothetical protein
MINEAATTQRAAQAYRNSALQGMYGRAAMEEAMRVMLTNLHLARDAARDRHYDSMATLNQKTLTILAVLRETLHDSAALTDSDAAPYARYLSLIYGTVFARLPNVLQHTDPSKEYAELIALLVPVYRAWQVKDAPEAAARLQPGSTRLQG